MKQRLLCAASYKHNLQVEGVEPDESSAAAREGTIAHALAEFCLVNGVEPRSIVGKALTVELDGVATEQRIEADMADNVAVYTSHCETLAMLADRRLVEGRVHVTLDVHGERRDDLLWGTADFIAITEGERIDVVDLKYGGLAVEPEENPQGIAYLLGALELTDKPIKAAAIHIVQPRLSKEPKIWEIEDVPALVEEWKHKFEQGVMRGIEAAALTNPLDSQYCAGEHCRYCAAIPTCHAFAARLIDLTSEELEAVETDAPIAAGDELERLVERFKNKSIVNHYYDRLGDHLMRALRAGKPVPGLKIVRALGNRQWTIDDKELVAKLRNQGLKKPQYVEEKIMGPAKVERLIDNPKFFEKYTARKDNGEKLVPDTDKRPAIDVKAELDDLSIDEPEIDRPEDRTKRGSSHTMDLIEIGEAETEAIDDLILGIETETIDDEDLLIL